MSPRTLAIAPPTNYRYNNRGRLDQLTIGSTVTADYTYDSLERMAVRTTQNMTPAGTTHYVYDRAGHLIVEADDTGATLREYVWLDDMPLAVVADVDTVTPHLYYVHVDHLNRPIVMTDASKAVVWNAVYRPFGEDVSVTGSASNNLRFPGQYFLIEDGLAYNWHRHYDATTGRYLQPDPLGFVDGPSVYAYAQSAPTMHVDRDGRFVPFVAAVVSGVANFGIQLAVNYYYYDMSLYRSLYCVDLTSVAIGSIAGVAGPSLLQVLSQSYYAYTGAVAVGTATAAASNLASRVGLAAGANIGLPNLYVGPTFGMAPPR